MTRKLGVVLALLCITTLTLEAKKRCIGFKNELDATVTIIAQTPKQGEIKWTLKPGESVSKEIKTGAGRSNFVTKIILKVGDKTIEGEDWSKNVINEWLKVRDENESCKNPVHFRVAMGPGSERVSYSKTPNILVPLTRVHKK